MPKYLYNNYLFDRIDRLIILNFLYQILDWLSLHNKGTTAEFLHLLHGINYKLNEKRAVFLLFFISIQLRNSNHSPELE